MSDESTKLIVHVKPASTPGTSINADIDRPPNLRGKQDDHATAFAILKQRILEILSSSEGTDTRIHISPVIEKLLSIIGQEQKILKKCGLIVPDELLLSLKQLIEKISPTAQLRNEIDLIDDIKESIPKALAICEKQLKITKNQTHLSEFLTLYSIIITYRHIINLIDDLGNRINIAQQNAKKQAELLVSNAVKQFAEAIKKHANLATLPPETQKIVTQQLVTTALPYVQDTHARTNIEAISNVYAKELNKLPFVTFIPIAGVSGKIRHGGGGVTSAMKHFVNACKANYVQDAVIYMSLLLDFHPLSQEKLIDQQKIKDDIIQQKITPQTSFSSTASRLALIRDNNKDVFCYVVARHWQIMRETFPVLEKCTTKETIKCQFIEHMLMRWKFADLKPTDKLPSSKDNHTGGYQQELEETQEKQKMLLKTATDPSRWEPTGIDETYCRNNINDIIKAYEQYVLSAPPSPGAVSLDSYDVRLSSYPEQHKSSSATPPIVSENVSQNDDKTELEQVMVESRRIAQEQGTIGPRDIPGWELLDVEDKGNCFYDAVVDQMNIIHHTFLASIPTNTAPRDSLRLQIQGREFKDMEWADQPEIEKLARTFDVIVAIVDTRDPTHKFIYHYIDSDNGYQHSEILSNMNNKMVIKLAFTGNHYLSVLSHPTMNLQPTELPTSVPWEDKGIQKPTVFTVATPVLQFNDLHTSAQSSAAQPTAIEHTDSETSESEKKKPKITSTP